MDSIHSIAGKHILANKLSYFRVKSSSQHLTFVSNGGYRQAGLGLSLDIIGQGRGQGKEQSHPDPQGGGSQGQCHRQDQARGQR